MGIGPHSSFVLFLLLLSSFVSQLISAVADIADLKRVGLGSLEIQDATIAKNSPSGHHRTILSGYIFAIDAHIYSRKKHVKRQCLLHMSSQYGELRITNG